MKREEKREENVKRERNRENGKWKGKKMQNKEQLIEKGKVGVKNDVSQEGEKISFPKRE